MPIESLDHVNIRTTGLERMIDFYGRVLDMQPGPRPPFEFPGAWLYNGGRATVHLILVEEEPPPYRADHRLEHFAFRAVGLPEFLARLRREGVAYYCRDLPGFGVHQVNFHDCDGNHIHVDFPPHETVDVREFPGATAPARARRPAAAKRGRAATRPAARPGAPKRAR